MAAFPTASGAWVAVVISIFSYLSVEMIAVAAGEAEDPERAVKQAFRATIVRLVVFYLLTLALILAIVPWDQAGKGGSPFVKVMQAVDSLCGRRDQLHRAGGGAVGHEQPALHHHPHDVQPVARRPCAAALGLRGGTPLNALLLSTSGIAIATVLNVLYPETSFTLMMAISMFGALFTWMMIFVTHYFFRRRWAREGGAAVVPHAGLSGADAAGALAMLAILLTTYFTSVFKMTLVFGVLFLLALSALYYLLFRKRGERAALRRGWSVHEACAGLAGGQHGGRGPAERDAYTAWTWGDTPCRGHGIGRTHAHQRAACDFRQRGPVRQPRHARACQRQRHQAAASADAEGWPARRRWMLPRRAGASPEHARAGVHDEAVAHQVFRFARQSHARHVVRAGA